MRLMSATTGRPNLTIDVGGLSSPRETDMSQRQEGYATAKAASRRPPLPGID